MQAIQTKYLGPTNTKGARISARCDAKRIVLPWDYSLDAHKNHARAAHELAQQLGWLDRWDLVSGSLPDGSQCHVLVRKLHPSD